MNRCVACGLTGCRIVLKLTTDVKYPPDACQAVWYAAGFDPKQPPWHDQELKQPKCLLGYAGAHPYRWADASGNTVRATWVPQLDK